MASASSQRCVYRVQYCFGMRTVRVPVLACTVAVQWGRPLHGPRVRCCVQGMFSSSLMSDMGRWRSGSRASWRPARRLRGPMLARGCARCSQRRHGAVLPRPCCGHSHEGGAVATICHMLFEQQCVSAGTLLGCVRQHRGMLSVSLPPTRQVRTAHDLHACACTRWLTPLAA